MDRACRLERDHKKMPGDSEMNLDRWLCLMNAWGFGANRETFDSLLAAYSEVGRHYHTEEHILACLRHMDGCKEEIDSPREVEVALWFHDAIYKPFSSRNEKESADWAVSFLKGCEAAGDEVDRVRRLVMVTEHNAPARTRDERFLIDFDLSILGEAPDTYESFERNIREEYRLVPSFLYRKKRAAILRGFLERPKIYTSGCFPEEVEAQARRNLSKAISNLE